LLPYFLKLRTPLWSTREKVVVQRLMTLRQFKDRGFFGSWPILPPEKLSRVRVSRKWLTNVLEPRNRFNLLDESRDGRTEVALRIHDTTNLPETLPANDKDKLPGPPARLHTARNRNAAPVSLIRLFCGDPTFNDIILFVGSRGRASIVLRVQWIAKLRVVE